MKGEILPKLPEEITKLNRQRIKKQKKISTWFHTRTSHRKYLGLVGGWTQEWVWDHLEKVVAMVKTTQALEPGRLGPKSWLCHTGHVSSEPQFIHMKNNNVNLSESLGGLELISYVKCLEHSRCTITSRSYDEDHWIYLHADTIRQCSQRIFCCCSRVLTS